MLATFIALSVLLSQSVTDEPFTELDYTAALDQAKAEGKLLLIDFTASWCQPCKRMEKETWAAPNVRTWLGTNAISLQVDVDKQKGLAAEFKIQAMPTVVALRNGEVFDRVVGYQNADDFLKWGRKLLNGKRASDGLLEESQKLMGSKDVPKRRDLANRLVLAKQYDEALEQFLWMWPASRDYPGWGGVRLSFLLSDISKLMELYEPAREAFYSILDEQEASFITGQFPGFDIWMEWSSMCQFFGEQGRMIAWYDRERDGDGRLYPNETRNPGTCPIVDNMFAILIHDQRALDALQLYAAPIARAKDLAHEYANWYELAARFDGDIREQMEASHRRGLIEGSGQLYGALLKAGRNEEARATAEILLQTLDTRASRLGLVRLGMSIGQTTSPDFTPWLDQAEAAGAKTGFLRRKLKRLAEKSHGDERDPTEQPKK